VAVYALRVELTETLAYWTVVDEEWRPVALADSFLHTCVWVPIAPRAPPAPMPATWRAICGGAGTGPRARGSRRTPPQQRYRNTNRPCPSTATPRAFGTAWYVSARYAAQAEGSTLTSWIVRPAVAEALSKLKVPITASGSGKRYRLSVSGRTPMRWANSALLKYRTVTCAPYEGRWADSYA